MTLDDSMERLANSFLLIILKGVTYSSSWDLYVFRVVWCLLYVNSNLQYLNNYNTLKFSRDTETMITAHIQVLSNKWSV